MKKTFIIVWSLTLIMCILFHSYIILNYNHNSNFIYLLATVILLILDFIFVLYFKRRSSFFLIGINAALGAVLITQLPNVIAFMGFGEYGSLISLILISLLILIKFIFSFLYNNRKTIK